MKNRSLFLLFNHTLTPAQEADARLTLGVTRIVEPPDDLKKIWSAIPPDMSDIDRHIEPFRQWLFTEARKNDAVLIQGDFGACHIMVKTAFDLGLVPIYSTTERKASETVGPDGSVILIHQFNHRMFRFYTR